MRPLVSCQSITFKERKVRVKDRGNPIVETSKTQPDDKVLSKNFIGECIMVRYSIYNLLPKKIITLKHSKKSILQKVEGSSKGLTS